MIKATSPGRFMLLVLQASAQLCYWVLHSWFPGDWSLCLFLKWKRSIFSTCFKRMTSFGVFFFSFDIAYAYIYRNHSSIFILNFSSASFTIRESFFFQNFEGILSLFHSFSDGCWRLRCDSDSSFYVKSAYSLHKKAWTTFVMFLVS